MNHENLNENIEKVPGVLGVKEENDHFVVSIRWKDGKEDERHFPINGFTVVNPETNQKLGFVKGDKAVKILRDNVATFNEEDFSWADFIS